jgi:hypothetical protein
MPNVTITFTPNNPQQHFVCNPDPVPVPYGNNQVVTWNLNGPAGSAFTQSGISFKNTSPGTLLRVSDTQYQLTDNNGNTSGSDVDYPYTVSVDYAGSQYDFDPEVANESGGGTRALRYHSA